MLYRLLLRVDVGKQRYTTLSKLVSLSTLLRFDVGKQRYTIDTSPTPGCDSMELMRWLRLDVSGPHREFAPGRLLICRFAFCHGRTPPFTNPLLRKLSLKWFVAMTPTLRGNWLKTNFLRPQ